jgi:hypothetical protein
MPFNATCEIIDGLPTATVWKDVSFDDRRREEIGVVVFQLRKDVRRRSICCVLLCANIVID